MCEGPGHQNKRNLPGPRPPVLKFLDPPVVMYITYVIIIHMHVHMLILLPVVQP